MAPFMPWLRLLNHVVRYRLGETNACVLLLQIDSQQVDTNMTGNICCRLGHVPPTFSHKLSSQPGVPSCVRSLPRVSFLCIVDGMGHGSWRSSVIVCRPVFRTLLHRIRWGIMAKIYRQGRGYSELLGSRSKFPEKLVSVKCEDDVVFGKVLPKVRSLGKRPGMNVIAL